MPNHKSNPSISEYYTNYVTIVYIEIVEQFAAVPCTRSVRAIEMERTDARRGIKERGAAALHAMKWIVCVSGRRNPPAISRDAPGVQVVQRRRELQRHLERHGERVRRTRSLGKHYKRSKQLHA